MVKFFSICVWQVLVELIFCPSFFTFHLYCGSRACNHWKVLISNRIGKFFGDEWERKKWKHWLFPKPYNNSSFSRYPCGPNVSKLSKAGLGQQAQFVLVAACCHMPIDPSPCPTLNLVTFRICCKSRCSIWLRNPQRTNYWYVTEVQVDILKCRR